MLRLTRLMVLAALVYVPAAAPSVMAFPLMCQARGGPARNSPPPMEVVFQALAAGGISPYSFKWKFGDGDSSSIRNPTHVFQNSGSFDVVLTVRDSSQPRQTCRDTITIDVGIIVDYFCLASVNTTWGPAPLAVDFRGQVGFGGAEPYTWEWTFGDGGTSPFQNPAHTFAEPGTYYVSLKMRDSTSEVFPCHPTLRITAIPPAQTPVVPSTWGEVKGIVDDAPRF